MSAPPHKTGQKLVHGKPPCGEVRTSQKLIIVNSLIQVKWLDLFLSAICLNWSERYWMATFEQNLLNWFADEPAKLDGIFAMHRLRFPLAQQIKVHGKFKLIFLNFILLLRCRRKKYGILLPRSSKAKPISVSTNPFNFLYRSFYEWNAQTIKGVWYS